MMHVLNILINFTLFLITFLNVRVYFNDDWHYVGIPLKGAYSALFQQWFFG